MRKLSPVFYLLLMVVNAVDGRPEYVLGNRPGHTVPKNIQAKELEIRVREVSAVQAKVRPDSIAKQLEDPRWYCENNQVRQPREAALGDWQNKPEFAEHVKSKGDATALVDWMATITDVPADRQSNLLDRERRQYPPKSKEAGMLGWRQLRLCVDEPAPLCVVYADSFLANASDPKSITDRQSCLLAIAYAQTKDSADKAKHFMETCSDPKSKQDAMAKITNADTPQNALAYFLALAFSESAEEKDRYARLLLSLPTNDRTQILHSLQAATTPSGTEKLTECDLLRPKTLQRNSGVVALLLSQPELVPRAAINSKRTALAEALTTNPSFEAALLPHLLDEETSTLRHFEKELSSTTQRRLTAIRPLIEKFPAPSSVETSHPAVSKQPSDRGSFRPPTDLAEVKNLLESTAWTCTPKMQSSRQLSKAALKTNPLLAEKWKKHAPTHDSEKLQQASRSIASWKKGKITIQQLSVRLFDFYNQIPEATAAKDILRNFLLATAPSEYQPILKGMLTTPQNPLAGDSAKAWVALAFSDRPTDRELYAQTLLVLNPEDLPQPLTSPNVCPMTLGRSPLSTSDIQVMAQLGEAAIPGLMGALVDSDELVRSAAATSLGGFADKALLAVPALINALADSSKYMRAAAAKALGEIGEKAHSAVPALIQALDDPDGYTRSAAAHSLGKIGEKAHSAVPFLIQKLADSSLDVARCAAFALGAIGENHEATVQALIEILSRSDDPNSYVDDRVRGLVASALGQIGEKAHVAVPALVQALAERSPEVRRQAADALSKIGEKAVPFLTEALADKSSYVRIEAAHALGQLGSKAQAAIPILQKLSEARGLEAETAKKALEQIKSAPPN